MLFASVVHAISVQNELTFQVPLPIESSDVPSAVKIFYDRILSGPSEPSLELVQGVVSDDYMTRTNPLNPIEGVGPFPDGVQKLAAYFKSVFRGFNVKRRMTLSCQPIDRPANPRGQFVSVLSTITGTVGDNVLPNGLPMFPGIDVEQLKGKSFSIQANDVHFVRDGKIHRSWHVEDWESAKAQMLNGAEPPLLDAPQIRSGQTLRRFPTALKNFYDIILNIRDNGNCSNYCLFAGGCYCNHMFGL